MSENKYYPTARIGFGFDPLEPWSDKSASGVFSWTEDGLDEKKEGANISFEIHEVETESQFMEALSVNVSAKARLGLFEGSLDTSISTLDHFDNNTFVLILKGKIVFKPDHKKGILKLTEEGQRLLDECTNLNNLTNFYRKAGTKVISSQTKSASISVIYSYRTTSQEKLQALKSFVKAKNGSLTGAVNLHQDLASIDKTASLVVTSQQDGVILSDTNILNIIASAPGDFNNLRNIISESLKQIKKDNCQIESFGTIDIADNFGLTPYRDFLTIGRSNRNLERLFFEYQNTKSQLNLIKNSLSTLLDYDFSLTGKAELKKIRVALDERLLKLDDEGGKILYDCKANISIPDEIEIPWTNILSENWLDFLGWTIDASASQWWNGYNWTATVSYIPNITIRKTPLIVSGTIFRNGIPVEHLNIEEIKKIALSSGSFSGIYKVDYVANPNPLWIFEGQPVDEARNQAKNTAIAQGNNQERNCNYKIEIYTIYGQIISITFIGNGIN